nr:MAG TPA: HeH/LEM domain [Caudoviricetes sp.]
MKALTAKRAVLYQGRMYEPGDALPAGDSKMVEAWLQAESAEWTGEDQKPAQEGQEIQGAAEGTQEGQEGQGAAEGTLDVVDGHLTRESLETMTKANLEKLAKDMGVEIPRGATKALIIERLAAVTVEAPAPDGGAQ